MDDTRSKSITAHLNPLPRAVRRTSEYLLLDGVWRFELDRNDQGLKEDWYKGHNYSATIDWPSSIEAVMEEAWRTMGAESPYVDVHLDMLVGWYEREFEIPADWLQDPAYIVQVTFGACGFETRVWLNGEPLHTIEGAEVHEGEYTSFSYELPGELLRPVNRLTVRTADTLDTDIPRGKQESRVYKRGGIWYQTISGPVRSIWLEPVLRNRLRSRLGVISTIEDGLVEFVVTTRVRDAGDYTITLDISDRIPGKPVGEVLAHDDVKLHLEAGEYEQRLVMHIPQAKLWSPDEPNLYRLQARMEAPSGATSMVETNFGMRKLEARGRNVYLNNKKTYLDGILYQPNVATFDQIARHMYAMRDLGCNLVRVHIAGIDPRIYSLADELGMLLWVEVPSPHSSNQRSRQHHWDELQRMLRVIGSHPSVAILSLYNEDWGAQDVATSEETREYMFKTFAYMRTYYPQLLVVDNDGWRHVSRNGMLGSHLMTVHLYTDKLDDWKRNLDRLVSPGAQDYQVQVGEWRMDLVVGDPYFYRGQVPLVVSEWGGFGWSGYAGPKDMQARSDRIASFKRAMRLRPVAGDVYTQATSIEEEVNGLIDPETGALLVPKGTLKSRDFGKADNGDRSS
ncbi:MAG: sugar-binding domain-containing protein [Chloroflexota bacterium]